jgi:hypothetical protein
MQWPGNGAVKPYQCNVKTINKINQIGFRFYSPNSN